MLSPVLKLCFVSMLAVASPVFAQDEAGSLGGAPEVDQSDANPQIGTDPLIVDPLLGMELEALRRLVQQMEVRIEELENRVAVVEGAKN